MALSGARQAWWQRWGLWLTGAAALAIFFYLQQFGTLADPDSFYHARLTVLMRDSGLVRTFLWTQSSLYSTVFIDHHLGYHLLLIPWVSIWPPLLGLQLATIAFATLTIVFITWLMRRWRVPWWGLGALLLLTASPFIFRLSLGKAPSVGVGFALVGYYLIVERKLGWLFWWMWGFVWLYSAWPLLPVMAALFVAVSAVRFWPQGLKRMWAELWQPANMKLLGVVVAGCIAGLVINPYFPENMRYLQQLFTMALVAYHKFIGVGGEWYPYDPFQFASELTFPLLVWILAAISWVIHFRRQSDLSRTTWVLTFIFFIYTLRARRQVEYLSPLLILSTGLVARDSVAGWAQVTWAEFWQRFSSWCPSWLKVRWVQILLVIYFVAVVPWGLLRGIANARYFLTQGFRYDSLAGAAQWLQQHTPPATVVFQTDWGTFPLLFYHNTHNYYLTGLDQTFMYVYNQDHYWQWVDLVTGKRFDAYNVVHDTFKSSYVLVERRVAKIMGAINKDSRFHKVYGDSETLIYSLVE